MEQFVIQKKKGDTNDPEPGPSRSDTSLPPPPPGPPLQQDSNKKRKDRASDISESEPELGEQQTRSVSSKKLVSKPSSKKKEYLNKFSLIWLDVPEFKGWLEKSKETLKGHELAYCRLCNTNITAHRNDITRHSKAKKHLELSAAAVSSRNIGEALKLSIPSQQKRAELKLAAFIAEKNLPISTIDELSEILPDMFPDSKIAKGLSIHRTKATALLKNSMGKEFSQAVVSKLKPQGNFFSIIMDETTDKGSTKQCAFVVIYFDNDDDLVKTRFLAMKETSSSSADDLVSCLKNVLNELEIPMENLVGYSSDTTNVMFGQFHSVVSLLRSEIPHGVFIKCSCHLIHLVASKACLNLPRSIEDLLRNLGSHFSRSFGRQEKLKEFQEFFSVEVHKILSLSCTRWLSCKQVVDRVLEQYTVLQAYLTETVFDDPSKTTEEMLSTMNQPFTELYLEFMSYALGLFTSFNTLFQSESPLLHKVKFEVESLMRILAKNIIKDGAIKGKDIFQVDFTDKSNFVEDKRVYLGLKGDETFYKLRNDPKIPKEDVSAFINNVRAFYVEALRQLKTRFDLNDPVYNVVQVVDPQIAQEFEDYPTLRPVFERFPMLTNYVNREDAEQEWRNHSLLTFEDLALNPCDPPVVYWGKVFKLKDGAGNHKFLNLKKIIRMLLILPFSNACVERVFSTLNNVKTANRNRLKTDTLNALLCTKEGIEEKGGIVRFEPSPSMLKSSAWK